MVETSAYFAEHSGHPLDQEGAKLIVNDGRNHLLIRPHGYDVISYDPPNPLQRGTSNLFTSDFYRLATRRLNEGDIFCQRTGLYDITPDNLKIAHNTFLHSFGQMLAFRCDTGHICKPGQLQGSRKEKPSSATDTHRSTQTKSDARFRL